MKQDRSGVTPSTNRIYKHFIIGSICKIVLKLPLYRYVIFTYKLLGIKIIMVKKPPENQKRHKSVFYRDNTFLFKVPPPINKTGICGNVYMGIVKQNISQEDNALFFFAIIIVIVIICGFLQWYLKSYKPKDVLEELNKIDLMSGYEFEQYTSQLIKKNGFSNVNITKQSGDFGADIIAYYNGGKCALQCKCYHRKVGLKPVQEVYAAMQYYHCESGIVITNSYFTQGTYELAKKTGVMLWDRDDVARLINNAIRRPAKQS